MSRSTPVRVRRATIGDADALGDVHVRVWRWAYRGQMPDAYLDRMRAERRAEIWREDLTADRFTTWVAEVDRAVVGFAGVAPTRDEDLPSGTAELVMINVLESHAGRGVGRALLATVDAHWRASGVTEAVLWVLAPNTRARAVYSHLGWVPDGRTGHHVVDDVAIPQLRMRKSFA